MSPLRRCSKIFKSFLKWLPSIQEPLSSTIPTKTLNSENKAVAKKYFQLIKLNAKIYISQCLKTQNILGEWSSELINHHPVFQLISTNLEPFILDWVTKRHKTMNSTKSIFSKSPNTFSMKSLNWLNNRFPTKSKIKCHVLKYW